MKNKLLILLLIASSSLFLVNCSKSKEASVQAPVTTAVVAAPTNTCVPTDVVNTQNGVLTVGVCQPYCAQYGRKYGYSNGLCYPAL
jgi:hypothetical protein